MVAYHFCLNYQTRMFSFQAGRFRMADFIDNQSADSFSALTSFPSLADFSAAATADALKWTNLEQNVVYQILSTRTVNTQHGQSVILSLQKVDGSSFSVWACGMLSKKLLQKPIIMVGSRLFVMSTGKKTSKVGRVYSSYQLLQCWFVNLFVISLCNICKIGILVVLLELSLICSRGSRYRVSR